jgi:transcriptional regulator with XRE-family HTH domain
VRGITLTGEALKAARGRAKLGQAEAAEKLGVTQAYLSMLEGGRRPVTEEVAVRAARVFRLPATALPMKAGRQRALDVDGFKAELGAMGFPGFPLVRGRKPRYNPARLIFMAIDQDELDRSVVEALPFVVLKFANLDWEWLLREAKLHDRQNRLGFLVDVAMGLAKELADPWQGKLLEEAKVGIERSRLAREDTLCDDSMTEKERKKLRQKRTAKARHWNLLTDMEGKELGGGRK